MNRSLRLTLAVLVLAACGQAEMEQAPTPRERFDTFQGAISDRDWDEVYSLTPPSERAAFERHWENEKQSAGRDYHAFKEVLDGTELANLTYREVFALLMDRLSEKPGAPLGHLHSSECTDEVVEGVRCRLRLRCPVSADEQEVPLRREEGRWFVSGLHALARRDAHTSR